MLLYTKKLRIQVDLEYDTTRLTASEVRYNFQKVLDEYFNRLEEDYGEDAIKVIGNEDVSVLSGLDKS